MSALYPELTGEIEKQLDNRNIQAVTDRTIELEDCMKGLECSLDDLLEIAPLYRQSKKATTEHV